jgi:hypothetical protein
MFEFKAFVGIDISKKTFDAAFVSKNAVGINHQCFSQSKEGFTAFLKWLNRQQVALCDTLICMEHTGLYTNGIIHFEAKALEQLQQPAVAGLQKAKEKIEAAIKAFIASEETINKSIGLMCSIKGIGLQTAASLYVYVKGSRCLRMQSNWPVIAVWCRSVKVPAPVCGINQG